MAELTVCRAADLPPGSVTVVTVGGKEVAVFNDEGKLYAIDDRCPHAGASLAGGYVENGVVTCPLHAWRFRLSDGAWADNPKLKVGCYPVAVADGQVRISLPTTAPNG